jgi:hypothetical protein
MCITAPSSAAELEHNRRPRPGYMDRTAKIGWTVGRLTILSAMHTGEELASSTFDIRVAGRPGSIADAFPASAPETVSAR